MNGIADYVFVHSLGEGRHGSFWLARCPERLGRPDSHVAVKTFVHHADQADFERLTTVLQRYYLVSERPVLNETLRDEERMVIGRSLAVDPMERPSTALEFAEIVDDIASRLAAAEPA